MADQNPIADNELILRRIPPNGFAGGTWTVMNPDGTVRPTSSAFSIRSEETGISCSRRHITSPSQLLEFVREQGWSPDGWMVAELRVGDVRALELEVVPAFKPGDPDPGHCEIRATTQQALKRSVYSKLAKRISRILPPDEMI